MKTNVKFLSILLAALVGFSFSSKDAKEVNEAEENLVVRHVLRQNATNNEGAVVNTTDAPEANGLVSDVLAQVNTPTNGAVSMRFVAGIDSYTYENAQFNITLKDAEGTVVKAERSYTVSSAYLGVEANNEVKYASDLFGEGYNYLIAYTLTDIPEDYWNYQFDVTAETTQKSLNVATKRVSNYYNVKVNTFKVDGTKLETRYEKVALNEVYTVNAPVVEGYVASHDYVKGYLNEGEMATHNIYYSEVDVWDGTSVSASLSGAGTASDPYLIQSGADLAYLKSVVDAATSYKENTCSGQYFKMTKSIDLNGADFMIGYHTGWNAYDGFAGTFDGNNCSIRGLGIERSSESTGLFACVKKGALLKNLSLYGSVNGNETSGVAVGYLLGTIENVTSYVNISAVATIGGIAANGESSSSLISNCVNYGSVTGTKYIVGGIVGSGGHNVDECVNFGTVNTGSESGGIVGSTKTTGAITNNVNYGVVTGAHNLGGIVGSAKEKLENNTNYGSVSGTYTVGGVVGITTSAVSSCDNHGEVTGKTTHIGGIIGTSTSTVDNCENNGKVSGGSWGSAGIVASCTGDITNCVNNGDIYAEGQLGGIVGKLESATAKVSNNVNNGSINGTTKDDLVAGIVGNVTVAGYTDELKTILTTTNVNNGTCTGSDIHGKIS